MEVASAELASMEEQERDLRREVERVEGKREWVEEFRGWVEMLGGFLEEKVRSLVESSKTTELMYSSPSWKLSNPTHYSTSENAPRWSRSAVTPMTRTILLSLWAYRPQPKTRWKKWTRWVDQGGTLKLDRVRAFGSVDERTGSGAVRGGENGGIPRSLQRTRTASRQTRRSRRVMRRIMGRPRVG